MTLTDAAYFIEMIMHLISSFKRKENNTTRKACICIQLVTIETKRENFKATMKERNMNGIVHKAEEVRSGKRNHQGKKQRLKNGCS